MPSVAPVRAASLALITAALALSCAPRPVRPEAGADAGPVEVDVVVDDRPRPDRDNDGLCDDTEMRVTGTDPDDVDTDNDGFIDSFEYSYGLLPNSATSPSSERVLQWSEAPGEPFDYVFNFTFRGNGQGVFGLFYESAPGIDGFRGEDLGLRIEALSAVPPSNAPDIAGERFVSVVGMTRLSFRIIGDWPARAPLTCRRAYVLYPSAYAEELGLLYLRSFFLDVRASSAPFDAGAPSDASDASNVPDASDAAAFDATSVDASAPSPWPFQRDGYCLPRPGSCR
jgi:hypothetical protein